MSGGDRTCVCRCLQGKLQELQDQRKTRGEAMRPGQSVQAPTTAPSPEVASPKQVEALRRRQGAGT